MAGRGAAGRAPAVPLADRLSDARRSVVRAHVLDAAEEQFSRTAYGSVKVGDIARSAGVSLATLYKLFRSKDELWDALNADRMEAFTAAVLARTASISSPLERMLAEVRAEVEFFAEREAFLRLHLADGLSWGTASTIPGAGRGGQQAAWEAGMRMTTATAQAAIDAGEIVGQRPAVVAAVVISALQIWLTDWVAHDRDRPVAEVADEVVAHLRRALTVPPSAG